MKSIKKTILIATMMIMAATAAAQIKIPGTANTIRLNENDWRYLNTFKMDDGADIYLYYYVGHTEIDAEGDTVLPTMRIYVNKNFDGDLYELAYQRYTEQPYQSINDYTKGLGLPKQGGIGYEGVYTNSVDQKNYRFLMTYFKSGKAVVEIRLETTMDTFENMEFEFKDILGTLK